MWAPDPESRRRTSNTTSVERPLVHTTVIPSRPRSAMASSTRGFSQTKTSWAGAISSPRRRSHHVTWIGSPELKGGGLDILLADGGPADDRGGAGLLGAASGQR